MKMEVEGGTIGLWKEARGCRQSVMNLGIDLDKLRGIPSFSWDKFPFWTQCYLLREAWNTCGSVSEKFCSTQMTSSPSIEPETTNGPDLEPGSFTALRLVWMILGGSKYTD